jgi:hypothetical protein
VTNETTVSTNRILDFNIYGCKCEGHPTVHLSRQRAEAEV